MWSWHFFHCDRVCHRETTGSATGSFFFFFFWPWCTACGILVTWPGIQPMPPAWEAQSPSYQTCREVPMSPFLEFGQTYDHSTLAWKIPWLEEPGRWESMGSLRVGHDWATSLSFFTFMHWRRKWQPTPVFLPGESQGRGAWWAAVYGVSQSRTRLKWLSSSMTTEEMRLDHTWWCSMLPCSLGILFLKPRHFALKPKKPHGEARIAIPAN